MAESQDQVRIEVGGGESVSAIKIESGSGGGMRMEWDGFLVERGGEAGSHSCLAFLGGPDILPVAIR